MSYKIETQHGKVDVPCMRLFYITLNGHFLLGTDTTDKFATETELLTNVLTITGQNFEWKTIFHRDVDGQILYTTREFDTK